MSFLYELGSDYTLELQNSIAICINAVIKGMVLVFFLFTCTYYLKYQLSKEKGNHWDWEKHIY